MEKYHDPVPRDEANTIEKAIQKIRFEKVEHLYLFKNGKQIRRFIGDENNVTPSEKYLFEIENAIVIHNHPSGSSFSVEDVKTILKYNSKVLIVVTENYYYKVERPINGWNFKLDDKEINEILNTCNGTALNMFDKLIAKNELTLFDKEKDLFHYIWLLFFQIYEINYQKVQI